MHAIEGHDRGAINLVKIFLVVGVVGAGYLAWIYVPLYADNYAVRQSMKKACNVAYSARSVDSVKGAFMSGWKEAQLIDQVVGADGAITTQPTPIDDQNLQVVLTQTPPEVTFEVTYERQFVWPFSKKQRTKTFTLREKQDLSAVKW